MKTRKNIKILTLITLLLTLIIPQLGCTLNNENQPAENHGYEKTTFALDTVCTITIYGAGKNSDNPSQSPEERAMKLIEEGFSELARYEKMLSKTVETSDISKINGAGGKAVKVSAETMEVIEKGLYYSKLSEGAFDITCGALTDLWDFHRGGGEDHIGKVVPSREKLVEAVKHVDYRKVEIDKEKSTVRLSDPAMKLDLGGIAKGFIADKLCDYLKAKGATGATVNLGGNIAAFGGKPKAFFDKAGDVDFVPFRLGIKNPLSPEGDLLGIYEAKDFTVVTSGTYERYFVVDGVKYHHILDTKTGMPADTKVLQVTITAPEGKSADCDGLSTTCLSIGPEKGKLLLDKVNKESGSKGGFEAIFIMADGERIMTNPDSQFQVNHVQG